MKEDGNKRRKDIKKRSSRRGSRVKKLGKGGRGWKSRIVKEKGRERKIGKGMLEISKRKKKKKQKDRQRDRRMRDGRKNAKERQRTPENTKEHYQR